MTIANFHELLARQTCKTCRDKKWTGKCPGHANQAGDEENGDDLDLAPQAKLQPRDLKIQYARPLTAKHSQNTVNNPLYTSAAERAKNPNLSLDYPQPIYSGQPVLTLDVIQELNRNTPFIQLKFICRSNNLDENFLFQILNNFWNHFKKLHPNSNGSHFLFEKDAHGNIVINTKIHMAHFENFLKLLTNHNILSRQDADKLQRALQKSFPAPRGYSMPQLLRT